MDRLIYKDEPESMDSPSVPLVTRKESVAALNRLWDQSGFNYYFEKEIASLITSAPKSGKPLKIIDIATGGGTVLKVIDRCAKQNNLSVELYGVDYSADFEQYAESDLKASGINARIYTGDACNLLDIADQSFDFVFCNFMVHHLRSPNQVAAFFCEMNRIARQGWLIIDLNRSLRCLMLSAISNVVFGMPSELAKDSIKSARRAYQVEEINFILDEIRKENQQFTMKCLPHSTSPYWLIKGKRPS